jgi:hypothetical protein
MVVKKEKSEEQFFLEFIKNLSPLTGTFGSRSRWDKDKNKLVPEELMFLAFDENLNVIFEHTPYNNHGNYHLNVRRFLEDRDMDDDDKKFDELSPKEQKRTLERSRTDNSVEAMISSLIISSSLSRFGLDKTKEVEESSDEFKALRFAVDCHNNSVRRFSDSAFENRSIEYWMFTEKGQKSIDNQIEWFKNNTSITPVQDAWKKVLEKNGIESDFKPYTRWCELPVMRPIDYSTKEELDAKHKKEDEDFKKSLSPEVKKQMKELAEKLKNKS